MQVWVRYILIAFFIVLFFGGAPLYVYVYMLFLNVLLPSCGFSLRS